MAGVGKMRMVSLVKYLKDDHSVTVIQNSISSYDVITNEAPIENVRVVEANVKDSFISDLCEYKRVVKKELEINPYDVVLITVGPYFTLPLVKLIKRTSRIPVIVDYRDLWTNSYREHDAKSTLKTILKTYCVERPALKKADAYTSCDERSVEVLSKQYSFLHNAPKQHIYNGYDDAELKDVLIETTRKYLQGKTNIGIYGKFESYIGHDNVKWFVEELIELSEKKDEKIKIIHYGRREEYFESVLRNSKIEYDWRGFVEYKVGMNALSKEADVLLAANDVMIGYGTKVFDYIYLNKPIVMFAFEESDLKTFVKSFENGYSFTTREELKDILTELAEKRPCILAQDLNPELYGRARQNRRFEEFISRVVAEKNR